MKDKNMVVEKKYNKSGQSIYELWKRNYVWMIVENVKSGDKILLNCNHEGGIYIDYLSGKIEYMYADDKYGRKSFNVKKKYYLSNYKASLPEWILVRRELKR